MFMSFMDWTKEESEIVEYLANIYKDISYETLLSFIEHPPAIPSSTAWVSRCYCRIKRETGVIQTAIPAEAEGFTGNMRLFKAPYHRTGLRESPLMLPASPR